MGKAGQRDKGQATSDAALWQHAMRSVAPLRGRKPPPPLAAVPPGQSGDNTPPIVPKQAKPAPLPPLDRQAGVDRASAQRLKRGMYAVEARLDLHGMTQAEAHRALAQFIDASRTAGRRCVLVITGHGRDGDNGRPGGVLKKAVPRWLEEPELRHQLLITALAQPRDGGAGALYLLLRKRR